MTTITKTCKTLAQAAAMALALAATAAHASPVGSNLLADGDFEAFAGQLNSGAYKTVTAGNKIGAWTVGATSVDLIRNAYGAINDVSIDLSGTPGPGSLWQTFTATAGTSYQLSFDYYKNGGGTDLTVSFGGHSFVYTPGSTAKTATLNWTADTSGLQTLMFSGGNGNAGPVLDNVRLNVNAVPEPTSLALLVAGIGALGFASRRRKA